MSYVPLKKVTQAVRCMFRAHDRDKCSPFTMGTTVKQCKRRSTSTIQTKIGVFTKTPASTASDVLRLSTISYHRSTLLLMMSLTSTMRISSVNISCTSSKDSKLLQPLLSYNSLPFFICTTKASFTVSSTGLAGKQMHPWRMPYATRKAITVHALLQLRPVYHKEGYNCTCIAPIVACHTRLAMLKWKKLFMHTSTRMLSSIH